MEIFLEFFESIELFIRRGRERERGKKGDRGRKRMTGNPYYAAIYCCFCGGFAVWCPFSIHLSVLFYRIVSLFKQTDWLAVEILGQVKLITIYSMGGAF